MRNGQKRKSLVVPLCALLGLVAACLPLLASATLHGHE